MFSGVREKISSLGKINKKGKSKRCEKRVDTKKKCPKPKERQRGKK